MILDDIEQRYVIVMKIPDNNARHQALLDLRDVLLTEFGVLLAGDIEWDCKHTEVLDMYRKLAISCSHLRQSRNDTNY